VIAQHVEQRYLHDRGVEELGTLRESRTHEQPAVRASHDTEASRRGDPALDEILGDRDEIVVHDLTLRLEARLVPRRAELTAPADVREHVHAALLEPQLPDCRRIGRRHRYLKAAIRVQQSRRGTVRADRFRAHHEVRDPCAVARYGFELLGRVA
jgi:hypothetical protein